MTHFYLFFEPDTPKLRYTSKGWLELWFQQQDVVVSRWWARRGHKKRGKLNE